MMRNHADHVAFDFDGVLADSAPLIVEILREATRRHLGLDVDDELLRSAIGPPFAHAVADLCATSGVDPGSAAVEAIVAEFRSEYGRRAATETPLFPGMAETLGATSEVAIVTICSSKPRDLVQAIVDTWGIAGRFADVEAADPALPETKAIGLKRLISRLDASPGRTVLVGDTRFDAAAAAAVGTRFLGVSWGIGSADDLRAAGAMAVARTPAEIPPLVLELLEGS